MDSYEKEDKKREKATNHDKDRKQQKRKKSEEKETRKKGELRRGKKRRKRANKSQTTFGGNSAESAEKSPNSDERRESPVKALIQTMSPSCQLTTYSSSTHFCLSPHLDPGSKKEMLLPPPQYTPPYLYPSSVCIPF